MLWETQGRHVASISGLWLCAACFILFTLATTPKNSAKHPEIHKNDPNTKRLAPIGKFLNVTITVNKSSHLLSKLKRKGKKLILWTPLQHFFSMKISCFTTPCSFSTSIWSTPRVWFRYLERQGHLKTPPLTSHVWHKKAQLLCGSPKLKLLVHTLRLH